MTSTETSLLERFAISECAHRYSDAINRRDFPAVGRCFARDGQWIVLDPIGLDLRGAATIATDLAALLADRDLIAQIVTAVVVETVDGDTARARATVQETVRSADHSDGFRLIGVYDDELVREDGEWVYARRTFHPLYLEPGVASGTVFPVNL